MHKDLFEKNVEENNRSWLGSQFITDYSPDVDMEGIEKMSDYDIDEEDLRAAMEEYDTER